MIWIKRIAVLLVAVFLGLGAFVAGMLVFFDDTGYKRAAVWVADTFLDSKLQIDGNLTLHLGEELTLNVSDVRMDARDDGYHFSARTLSVNLRLWPLLSGTVWLDDLQVNQLLLKVNETAAAATDPFDPHLPPVIIASAGLKDLMIEYQEIPPGTLHRFSLNTLKVDEIAENSQIRIQGDGLFEGDAFTLRGKIPSIDELQDRDRLKPVELVFNGKNGHVTIAGTVTDLLNGEGLDLNLEITTPATRLLLEWLGDDIPDVGKLHASARLRGDYAAPRLENIDAYLQRGKDETISVRGSVDDVYSGAGLKLNIDGSTKHPEVASWLLFGKLGQLKSLSFKGVVEESDGQFYLSDIDAAASIPKGLSVKAQGSTELHQGKHLSLKSDSGITVAFSAPTTDALNLFDAADVPELGAVTGSAKILLSTDSIGIFDADVNIGDKGNSKARLQGQISDIPLHEAATATGIDLKLSVQSPDVSQLMRKLDVQIPAIGPGDASMKVIGDLGKLKLKGVSIRAGEKNGPQITARGNIDRVVLGKHLSVDNALFDVTAKMTDLSKLSELAGIDLPKLGQTVISSTLILNKSNLLLDKLKIDIGRPDQPTIRMHGKVATQLHKGSTAYIDYNVAVADLVAAYATNPPGYLGRLQGSAEISDIDGSWGIEKFDLASSQTSLYLLKLQGGFDDLKNNDQINIGVKLQIDDPAALGRALGIKLSGLKTFHGEGHLHNNNDVIAYNGVMSVGNTTSTTTVHGHTRKNKPTFSGKFSIPILDLTDFGFLGKQELDSDILAQPGSSSKDYLFSRQPLSVDFINDFDVDLQVNIDEIESYGRYSIDSVVGHIFLKNGKLEVDPLHFVYADGTMDVIFNLQATDPPAYALKVTADDLKLGPTLAQVENNTTIDGRTNILLDITGRGQSAHELASSLDGRINIEFENARIPKRYIDILSVDVFGWALSSSGAGQQYANLNCVVGDFTAVRGDIKSKILLADGPDMSIGGRIYLNLRDETIEAVVVPKQKRRMFSSISPVKLSGPIKDPRVQGLPAQTAIKELGILAISPTIYLSTRLLKQIWSSISKGGELGEGCVNIEKLTNDAEKAQKAKKKRPLWRSPFNNDYLLD